MHKEGDSLDKWTELEQQGQVSQHTFWGKAPNIRCHFWNSLPILSGWK